MSDQHDTTQTADATTPKARAFLFQWVGGDGHVAGFTRLKGLLHSNEIHLDNLSFPIQSIREPHIVGDHLRFDVLAKERQVTVTIKVTQISARTIKSTIDRWHSAQAATGHRQQMEADGKESAYRDMTCPFCHATCLLSEFDETPQVYCQHCHRLWTPAADRRQISHELRYGICEHCHLFSRPARYSIFYFYFLYMDSGFHVSRFWRCAACMRPKARKAMLVNAPFLLGVPWSLVQLTRAYANTWERGPFRGLDSANVHVRQGRIDRALPIYETILDQTDSCAGIKYNLGMGLLKQGDVDDAIAFFEDALNDCANFEPAREYLMKARACSRGIRESV